MIAHQGPIFVNLFQMLYQWSDRACARPPSTQTEVWLVLTTLLIQHIIHQQPGHLKARLLMLAGKLEPKINRHLFQRMITCFICRHIFETVWTPFCGQPFVTVFADKVPVVAVEYRRCYMFQTHAALELFQQLLNLYCLRWFMYDNVINDTDNRFRQQFMHFFGMIRPPKWFVQKRRPLFELIYVMFNICNNEAFFLQTIERVIKLRVKLQTSFKLVLQHV